jgi:hypothetical protein
MMPFDDAPPLKPHDIDVVDERLGDDYKNQ